MQVFHDRYFGIRFHPQQRLTFQKYCRWLPIVASMWYTPEFVVDSVEQTVVFREDLQLVSAENISAADVQTVRKYLNLCTQKNIFLTRLVAIPFFRCGEQLVFVNFAYAHTVPHWSGKTNRILLDEWLNSYYNIPFNPTVTILVHTMEQNMDAVVKQILELKQEFFTMHIYLYVAAAHVDPYLSTLQRACGSTSFTLVVEPVQTTTKSVLSKWFQLAYKNHPDSRLFATIPFGQSICVLSEYIRQSVFCQNDKILLLPDTTISVKKSLDWTDASAVMTNAVVKIFLQKTSALSIEELRTLHGVSVKYI